MFEPERLNRLTEIGPDNAPNDAPDQSGKSPVHATFDEAGFRGASAVALQDSNSETVIDAIIAEADRFLSDAGNNFDGLLAHSSAGQRLRELKTHLNHGDFDRVVKARLGITRQWRARLMKLAKDWPDILAAIKWAEASNRLSRVAYSVDGALTLLADWRRAAASGSDNSAPAESGNGSVPVNKTKLIEYLAQFLMLLLRELLCARRRIAFLEFEIERLNGSPYVDVPADQFALPLLEHAE